MIWFHELLPHHEVKYTDIPPVWVHGGKIPKRTLINCSCGKNWVRRGREPR